MVKVRVRVRDKVRVRVRDKVRVMWLVSNPNPEESGYTYTSIAVITL